MRNCDVSPNNLSPNVTLDISTKGSCSKVMPNEDFINKIGDFKGNMFKIELDHTKIDPLYSIDTLNTSLLVINGFPHKSCP